MKKTLLVTCLLVIAFLPAVGSADMMPNIPQSFTAIGPDLGWFWSDNLSGPALGFDAVISSYFLTGSAGMRYVASRDDGPDFNGNGGLLTMYTETTVMLPFPLGFGVSYNWAAGKASGPGLHLYWSLPLPLGDDGYLTIFYRPTWLWLNGNPETAHQLGIGWRFSDVGKQLRQPKHRPWMTNRFRTAVDAHTNR